MPTLKLVHDYHQSIERLRAFLLDPNPGFIGRIGGSDWDFVVECARNGNRVDLKIPGIAERFALLVALNGYYDQAMLYDNLVKFCTRYTQAYASCDWVTACGPPLMSYFEFLSKTDPYYVDFNREEDAKLVERCLPSREVHSYAVIESFRDFDRWFPLLEGKKVLTVCPFGYSFSKQFEKRDKLFKPNALFKQFRYPNFQLLTLNTPITYNSDGSGDKEFPHQNWHQTLDDIIAKAKAIDFDVALLSCGGYAMPVGAALRAAGKKVIYVGGVLQMFFGVLGRRWESTYFEQIINNEYWIRPLETPDKLDKDKLKDSPTEAFGAYF